MRTIHRAEVVKFLYKWQWVPILLTAPLFAFSKWMPLVPMVIVPGVWLAIWLAGGKPLVSTPINLSILLIALMVLVSVFATYDLRISLGFLSGSVVGLAFYFLVVYYGKTSRGWWIIFLVFIGLATLISVVDALLISWPQKISFLNPITSLLRTPLVSLPQLSVPPHANNLPVLLLSVLPIQLALTGSFVIHRKELVRTIGSIRTNGLTLLTVVITVVNLLIFLLSQSRGGYISLALTCIFFLFAAASYRIRWILAAGLAVGSLMLYLLLSRGQASPLPASIPGNPSDDTALSTDTLEFRIEMWSRAIYGIQDFPFTGMGINTFGHVMPKLYPLFTKSTDEFTNAHNTYLQVALDLGIPGLIAFVALQLGALGMWLKLWKTTRSSQSFSLEEHHLSPFHRLYFLEKGIVLGMGGVLLSQFLIGLTEANAMGTFLPVWVLIGLAAALYNQSQAPETRKDIS